MTKKDKVTNAQKLGIGVGLTAAAVAAAGAYFLYGSKDAPENRKKVKSGILKAKAEVLEVLENTKEITEEEFNDVVNGVVATYGKVKSLSKKDLAEFKKEMKDNWQDLLASGVAKVMTAEKVAEKIMKKKPVKKVASKTTKKATTASKPAKKATKKTTKKEAKTS